MSESMSSAGDPSPSASNKQVRAESPPLRNRRRRNLDQDKTPPPTSPPFIESDDETDECLGEDQDRAPVEDDDYQNNLSTRVLNDSAVEAVTVSQMRKRRHKIRTLPEAEQQQAAAKLLNTPFRLAWADDFEPRTNRGLWRDRISLAYHFDFTSVDTAPRKALAGPAEASVLLKVKVGFQKWNHAYRSYRAYTLGYTLYERCFHFAKIGDLLVFLVMSPRSEDITNASNFDVTIAKGMEKAAMTIGHAKQLCDYMLDVAQSVPSISRRGINAQFTLGARQEASFDMSDWSMYQEALFERWDGFVTHHPESFWLDHQPTIHVYDYGQDSSFTRSQLQTDKISSELTSIYNPASVKNFTFALATMVDYFTLDQDLPENVHIGGNTDAADADADDAADTADTANAAGQQPVLEPMALAFDTRAIMNEYEDPKAAGLRIFPVGFSPTVCSFQAKCAPRSYKAYVLDPINASVRERNHLDNHQSVVSDGMFQGYLGITQYVRKRQFTFELGKGKYVAGLCSPKELTVPKANKRNKFLVDLKSEQPFNAFDTAIDLARNNHRMGVRIEPVVSIDFTLLLPENRNFKYVCEEIIYPMTRWFCDGRELLNSWTRMYYMDVGFLFLRTR